MQLANFNNEKGMKKHLQKVKSLHQAEQFYPERGEFGGKVWHRAIAIPPRKAEIFKTKQSQATSIG